MSTLSKKSLLKTAIVMLLLTCVSSASFAFEKSASNSENEHKNEETQNFYVGLSVGQILPMHDLLSKSVNVSAGYKVKDFSIELEGIASANTEKLLFFPALMTNAYYHFNNNSNFTPYVGFGTGLVQIMSYRSPINLIVAYQGKVGLSYSAGNATEIFAHYKFFSVPNSTSQKVGDLSNDTDRFAVNQNLVEIGFRFYI